MLKIFSSLHYYFQGNLFFSLSPILIISSQTEREQWLEEFIMFFIMHAKWRELMSVEDFFRFFDLCSLRFSREFSLQLVSNFNQFESN